jgi:predicted Zn-dependent protease
MMPSMKRTVALLALLCLSVFAARPALAQSILRDAETEALLNEMSRPLIVAAGLQPSNVKVVLVHDPSINAFVAGGQIVYLHTGLIDNASSANEVQGVIAHELGHVTGGHAPLRSDGGATGISILSLLLAGAAMAAGSGDAGMGLLMMGQRAAIGQYLAFSRVQESSADAAGVRYVNAAQISGKGMLAFFKKLQNLEYRYGYYKSTPGNDPFVRSHPMSAERISTLTGDLQKAPAWDKPSDPALETRFKRVQAKLRGYVAEPKDTLRIYPPSDQSVFARYARAYAYHKSGYPEQAAAETNALVKSAPDDPYFLELQGQIMLESGDPVGSLVPLRRATESTNFQPLIAATFGHALIATDSAENLAEAAKVLRQAVARDRENPYAWYQLGIVYERQGDSARAALASAERANLTGDPITALAASRVAVGALPQNSADWVRAQDIQMVSQNTIEELRREGKLKRR